MFTDSYFMIKTSKVPGTVTLLFQFSEAISVFTSSQFYTDPLRPLEADGSDGAVKQVMMVYSYTML